ncbi:hypothetical protein MVLG_04107 [Microbotryum lychnidis-dioicae p1A1 Lamole]|uniref:Uncharacterized protein n=1 Tax=Microbotryum lychnidis-dioicae (strain p1A1 Lamole / MvSl-1064) TaxID=683840 RepID=U5HA73_USTV1|nr:hypothetical protein MVLG_04107 [Microbotryum lychnidis-dioicae p1A1 Lamole]|eukprot:KDE05514.1 hypothetical protein MVLG_04107 [Microbotryum lychnidis-dioicae p1A1 Lamole]
MKYSLVFVTLVLMAAINVSAIPADLTKPTSTSSEVDKVHDPKKYAPPAVISFISKANATVARQTKDCCNYCLKRRRDGVKLNSCYAICLWSSGKWTTKCP